MDKKNEFVNVMKGNSYLKLQKIINDKQSWDPEAVLAAESELNFREITIKRISESGLSDFTDKEVKILMSDIEKYPNKIIELINKENAKRETVVVVEKKAQTDKTKFDSNIIKNNNNYKVVPFNPSQNVSASLQSIINSEATNGWRYVNHQYSDKLQPGSSGCFGIGATKDSTIHVGFVIFEKI